MLARAVLAYVIGASQAPGEAVQWDAPQGCPDAAAVLAEVSRRLGRALAADEARAQGRIIKEGRGYVLRLELVAGERREARELRDPSCGALADAAALLIVAAVAPQDPLVPPALPPAEVAPAEPVVQEPAVQEPVEPVVQGPAAPGEVAVAEPEPAPEPAPRGMSRRPGGFLRLHGGGELGAAPGGSGAIGRGAVPGVTGAVGLAGGLLWKRLRLELQGAVIVPRTAEQPFAAGRAEIRAGLFVGAVHACGRVGRGAIEVPLCAGLEAGAARGEARGLPGGRAAVVPWVAAVLGPALAWHVGRWSVWGSAQLVLAPVRPRFEAGEGDAAELLFRPAVASGRVLLGVERRFGDPW